MIMNIWQKITNKPVVTFWSENETINELYPVYEAKDYKRKWVRSCAHAYQKYKKRDTGKYTLLTAAKCTGIRNVMEAGYIVQTWCDIIIETKDGKYTVKTPEHLSPLLNDIDYTDEPVGDFDMRYSPIRVPYGDNFPCILKFKSPYTVDVKPGYELMVLPVAYDDDPPFTACLGMTDGFQPNFIVHVYWHVKEGTVHIPAGTPLCQLVPVKQHKLEVKPLTDRIKKKIQKTLFKVNNTFKRGGSDW